MAESKIIVARPSTASPPPNCAICLGSCTNKCFSDSCMHQFCFKCLLEWSKIKAECPLCKQPFKSIIHNVKSNDEYDEHVVETTRSEEIHIIDNEEFLFLPLANTQHVPHRHQFHFRTTFTVDTRGEHAIQQMLLTHPLTNGQITFNAGYPGSGRNIYRRRRDFSATSFRRSIYARNLWVNSLPDITGRYRDISPSFFRDNPAARQRLVPWLNRELNALLFENTQLIMRLVDVIMDHLLRHHICSRTFRNLLQEYLGNKTDHFVHEFYNFMRSPFDMVGYDRHVIYTERPQSPAPFIDVSDNDDDSDVIIVGATTPSEPVVIDLVDSDNSSDEPIIVSTSSQVPMPILPQSPPSPSTVVNLPPKLRHKHRAVQEREWRRVKKRRRQRDSSSSSNNSQERERVSYRKYKRSKLLKKKNRKKDNVILSSSDSSDEKDSAAETEDDKPLIDIIKKKLSGDDMPDRTSRRVDNDAFREDFRVKLPRLEPVNDLPGCSRYSSDSSSTSQRQQSAGPSESAVTHISLVDTSANDLSLTQENSSTTVGKEVSRSGSEDEYRLQPAVKSEVREVRRDENAGPSHMKRLVLRKEDDRWYSYMGGESSDSSDD